VALWRNLYNVGLANKNGPLIRLKYDCNVLTATLTSTDLRTQTSTARSESTATTSEHTTLPGMAVQVVVLIVLLLMNAIVSVFPINIILVYGVKLPVLVKHIT